MERALIEFKDGKTKIVKLGNHLLEVPEILFTPEIEKITIFGKQGQFVLFIKNLKDSE